MLPILGPFSLRDAMELVGEFFLKPLSYVEYSETVGPPNAKIDPSRDK